jgi:hypothetical protein
MAHPRQAAKRMEDYLDDLDAFHAGDERMRELVNENAGEKDNSGKKTKKKGNPNAFRVRNKAGRRDDRH